MKKVYLMIYINLNVSYNLIFELYELLVYLLIRRDIYFPQILIKPLIHKSLMRVEKHMVSIRKIDDLIFN